MLNKLFVGDTIVVENGIWVCASRTYSHVKFAPIKREFGFYLTPANIKAGVTPAAATKLCGAVVDLQLGLYPDDLKALANLCKACLGCNIMDFYDEQNDPDIGDQREMEAIVSGISYPEPDDPMAPWREAYD